MADQYYYDEDTAQYVKVEKNFKYYARLTLKYGLIILGLTAAFIALVFVFHDSRQVVALKKENERYAEMDARLRARRDSMEQQLEELEAKDRQLYRFILNTEPPEEAQDSAATAEGDEQLDVDEIAEKLDKIESGLKKGYQNSAELRDLAEKSQRELVRIPTMLPVNTEIISGFGKRKNPITKIDKHHNGIDFKANIGTPVKVTADGVVASVTTRGSGLGRIVNVNHANGYSTVYACLKETRVSPGQRVKRGDVVALSGESGLSKGPHLHYEIHKNGKPVDPIDYLFPYLTPEQFDAFKKAASQYNESMD